MTLPAPPAPGAPVEGVLKLAIYAVGGQGGGVLTGWIETLARAQGWAAQATSVAGVSQRTGATIYYLELAPAGDRLPVFALMPAAGDVDVMIAAEWMEAGRAILRGYVTPDRTTLIASTHRNMAVSEKIVPGDGIADAAAVREAAMQVSRRLVAADFEAAAVAAGSVISATLFGALAASGALPFPRAAFEAAIRAGGRGGDRSLRAFAAGFDAALAGDRPRVAAPAAAPEMRGPARLVAQWNALEARVCALPVPVQDMALAGLRKVIAFQDCRYGADYLARVEQVVAQDAAPWDLGREAAKYIANAMAYDDVIRVADLKARAARLARIRAEMGAAAGNLLRVTEFMHPGPAEIAGMLPARLGARVTASPAWTARLGRWFGGGRRLQSDSLRGWLMLYLLGGLRFYRRHTLRHAQEMAHLDRWVAVAMGYHARNPALAVEVVRCRHLVKGYSDTLARGWSKFDLVLDGIALVEGRDDAADWARRLREAALRDEAGTALQGALQTIRSFA